MRLTGGELASLTRLGGLMVFRLSADGAELLSLGGDIFVDHPSPASDWISHYIPSTGRRAVEEAVATALQSHAPVHLVHEIRRKDGSIGWAASQAVPLLTNDGAIREWVGMSRDITTEREAQESAQRDAERQSFLLALADEVRDLSTPRCVMQLTAERLGEHLACGRVRYVEVDPDRSTFASSAEWANPALGVQPVADRFSFSQLGRKLLQEALEGKVLRIDDVRLDDRTAAQFALFLDFKVSAALGVPLVKDGQLVGALTVHHPEPREWSDDEVRLVEELAERTWAAVQRSKAESQLRQTQAELSLALDVAGLARWQFDIDTDTLSASDEFKALFGRPPEVDFTFPMLSAAIYPEDRPRCRLAVEEAAARKGSFDIEYRCIIDGSLHWIAASGRYDPVERLPGRLVGVAQDITARKRAQEEQRLTAERLKLIIDSAKDYAILTANDDGIITSWNSGAERILGFTEKEAIGEHLRIFFTQEDVEAGRPETEMNLAKQQGWASDERWHRRKDGSIFWASGEMMPVAADHMRGFVKIFRDLTERRRNDEQTQLLIDELNHRVKNTLATVQSITRQTLKGTDLESGVRQALHGRLMALAASHDLLTRSHWHSASLDDIVQKALEPFVGGESDRITINGPRVTLSPRTAVSLGLALHELATNAVRHGALSQPSGHIDIHWAIDTTTLTFTWSEQAKLSPNGSQRKGFGTRLLQEAVPYELGGTTQLRFSPDGLNFELKLPVENVAG
jgi:PAS domain S-box-containing protein